MTKTRTLARCHPIDKGQAILLKTVQEFSGSEQEDDITLVVARCHF
jgi:serine phosphatase RsbU (regulator of sigma subunit)